MQHRGMRFVLGDNVKDAIKIPGWAHRYLVGDSVHGTLFCRGMGTFGTRNMGKADVGGHCA